MVDMLDYDWGVMWQHFDSTTGGVCGSGRLLSNCATCTLLREKEEAERTLQNFLNAHPALMSSPLGLLPIDSAGMRQAIDEISRLRAQLAAVRKYMRHLSDCEAHNSGHLPHATCSCGFNLALTPTDVGTGERQSSATDHKDFTGDAEGGR